MEKVESENALVSWHNLARKTQIKNKKYPVLRLSKLNHRKQYLMFFRRFYEKEINIKQLVFLTKCECFMTRKKVNPILCF